VADDTVKKIKDLTATLSGKIKPLAKQAEAGFKSNWMGLNKEGKAEWADIMPDIRPSKIIDKYEKKQKDVVPGIVYNTMAIPSVLELISEGASPRFAVKADEKALKIKKAVEEQTGAPEPKGLMEHLARASGEMVAQIPTSGRTIAQKAVLKGPGLAEKAVAQGPDLLDAISQKTPSMVKKVLTAPVEYFSPVVDITTPSRAAMSYGVGTAFGGGLGYGIEKLLENDKKSDVQKLIDKYGTASGTESYDVSKPETRQRFEKGGLGTKLREGKSAFFSAIDNAIATLKQGKGTPEQLMSQVKKTPGVKKEELELRNLESKLAGKTSITKEELAEVAKKNPAPVPRVIRKKRNVSVDDQVNHVYDQGVDPRDLNYVLQWVEPDITDRNGVQYIKGFRFTGDEDNALGFGGKQVTPERVRQLVDKIIEEGYMGREEKKTFLSAFDKIHDVVDNRKLQTKYDSEGLRLEGGDDYRENLVQLPTRHEEYEKWLDKKGITNSDEAQKQWKMETGLPVPSTHDGYMGGHWGSEATNVVGHYRSQTFIDKDGKKVLYIEEIQSDPHQKARDKRKDKINEATSLAIQDNVLKLKEESPDNLPPGWKIEEIDKGNSEVDVRLIDNNGELIARHLAFRDVPDNAGSSLAEANMLLRHHSKLDKGFEEAAEKLVNKKEIAAQFPENYGYKTIEDEKKLAEIQDAIYRIRDNGLNSDEIAKYFTPGSIVKGYGGYDKVLEFHPATADTPWAVKVIAVHSDGTPERGAQPRTHLTSPEREVLRNLREEASKLEDNVYDMPWKKTYDELMLKQIIDDAVQEGFDRVAISPGITQVERYTNQTRKVLDKVNWESTDQGLKVVGSKDGNKSFLAFVKNGKIVDANNKDFVGESLDSVLGKDMSDKIKDKPTGGTIEGDDITVGGEGMKSFYDKRVPDFLRDYLKKEYNVELGITEFEHGEAKRAKQLSTIEDDIHRRALYDELTQDELDELQHLEQERFYDSVEKIAREKGLDPESPDVELMAFNDEGPFEGMRDRVQDYALNMLARNIYNQQPVARPVQRAPSFDITPDLATKVKEKGQRLFAAAPVVGVPLLQDDEAKAEQQPIDYLSKAPARPKVGEANLTLDLVTNPGLSPYGISHDGTRMKGRGYFGQLPSVDGMSTEVSSEDELGEFPLLTPNLSRHQINKILADPTGVQDEDILDLARKYATQRRSEGKSPFAQPGELMYEIPEYAKGGLTKKIQAIKAKLMFEDQPMNMSRRSMLTLPEATPVQQQATTNFVDQMVNKPMDRREFLQKSGNAAKNTVLRGALADLAPLAETPTTPIVQASKEIAQTPVLDQSTYYMPVYNKLKDLVKSEIENYDISRHGDYVSHGLWGIVRPYIDESKFTEKRLEKLDRLADEAFDGDRQSGEIINKAFPKLVDAIEPESLHNVLHNLPNYEYSDMFEFVQEMSKHKDIPPELMKDFLDIHDPRYIDFSNEEIDDMFNEAYREKKAKGGSVKDSRLERVGVVKW
jgi:hypothetical protein